MLVTGVIGDRVLFEKLNFAVTSGMRVGLVGPNGSGKTTLLRLLRGDLQPRTGRIRKAEPLRMVHFDQNRELGDGDVILPWRGSGRACAFDVVLVEGEAAHWGGGE